MLLPHVKLFLKIKRALGRASFSVLFFEEKYTSRFIILIDQISFPGCLYFVRYWAICLIQLFVNQVVTSWVLWWWLFGKRATLVSNDVRRILLKTIKSLPNNCKSAICVLNDVKIVNIGWRISQFYLQPVFN